VLPRRSGRTRPPRKPSLKKAHQPKKAAGKPQADRSNKKAEVIALMKRAKGATLAEIMAATKCQAHTIRCLRLSILYSSYTATETLGLAQVLARPKLQSLFPANAAFCGQVVIGAPRIRNLSQVSYIEFVIATLLAVVASFAQGSIGFYTSGLEWSGNCKDFGAWHSFNTPAAPTLVPEKIELWLSGDPTRNCASYGECKYEVNNTAGVVTAFWRTQGLKAPTFQRRTRG
jgi:hypothetical protein